ncbi:hypothetical protein ACJVC5_13330 [Peredibacter sp. HCB2-198]|uniref:hypothetical protein n=1 Tax=Peredibacter sp. HCB2-198 TaxID=3383025 RepID=UPI0038B5C517
MWNNLGTIQEVTGIQDDVMATQMGLSSQKFAFLKNNTSILPFTSVNRIADKLGINLDSILCEELNTNDLQNNFKGYFQSLLPDEYKRALGSKSFTVRNILKIAKKYGFYKEIQTNFSLNELTFDSNIDFEVSVQLASDLLDSISIRVPLTKEDYDLMSYGNAFHFADTEFGKILSECRTPLEIYEHLIRVVHHVEKNWSYKIEAADDKSILISSYSNENISDLYKRTDYSSYNFTKFRAAMACHLTKYIGLEGATTSITKSKHRGDSYDQFRIDYSNLRPLSSA